MIAKTPVEGAQNGEGDQAPPLYPDYLREKPSPLPPHEFEVPTAVADFQQLQRTMIPSRKSYQSVLSSTMILGTERTLLCLIF